MSQPPKQTERVYLSGSTWAPVLTAAGLAGFVIGLYAWWPYAVGGACVLLYGIVGWLRSNRSEIARMPVEQHTDTAPIPLSGRE
ncbi:MAG: hypothetical protein M3O25_08855 [Actinomycetota bacterium]|nr:hypothetical protein [Actinomycetota bacterium]